MDRDRRFLNVRTPDGKTGWLEEHAVIDPQTYNAFLKLRRDHEKDPVVATGVLRDELFAHLAPGRDTDRYFLLPEPAVPAFVADPPVSQRHLQAMAQVVDGENQKFEILGEK